MRHQKRGRKLGRSASHRKAMLSNMAASLLIHKQVRTTEAKAKEARKLVERLITYGKKGTTHTRRLAFAILRDKKATTVLFEEIAPVYEKRQGGYTRLIKLGYRPNDTAKVVLLQLVDFFSEEDKKGKKKPAKSGKQTETKKAAVKAGKAVEETVVETETDDVTVEEPADETSAEDVTEATPDNTVEEIPEAEDKSAEEQK